MFRFLRSSQITRISETVITFVTLMSTISPQLQILVSEVLEVVKMILVGIPQ